MGKRILALTLVLALALPLSSPALGAEGTTFVDVSPDDWFAPYVQACVEEGLMEGVGDGQFAPGQILSGYECAVLALRLHDLGRGGDGTFAQAPEDWGYTTLSLPDGTVKAGYFSDGALWGWRWLHRGDSGHCGFDLDTEEAQAWGRTMDYQTAVLAVNGAKYTGQLHLAGSRFLYFAPANMDDYNAIQDARNAPLPQEWWRDAWYYAEQHDLTDLLMAGNEERWAFAYRIAAVTDLPAINEITGLPDTGSPDTLKLYRAGVLTGNDPYGTFDGYSHLTRAEAAAICARILRPELRVEFSPKPLETYEPYTLTYLRDDVARIGGPYRPMLSQNLLTPDCHILLRLDGTVLPLPEGYEIAAVGDGEAGLINWDVPCYGIMDSQGQFRECTRDEAYTPSNWAADPANLHNGYRSGPNPSAFFNARGKQVTPSFDWLGFIDPQGSGFVGMDGAIYRIQFENVPQGTET